MIAGSKYGRVRIGMQEILAGAKGSSAVGGSAHGSAPARPNAAPAWQDGWGRAILLVWRNGWGRASDENVHYVVWIYGRGHVERALIAAESRSRGHSHPVHTTVDGLTHGSADHDGFAAARSAGNLLIKRGEKGGCQCCARAIHSQFSDCRFRQCLRPGGVPCPGIARRGNPYSPRHPRQSCHTHLQLWYWRSPDPWPCR